MSAEATTDRGAWALALALQILGVPAEADQIEHDMGRPQVITAAHLIRAARRFPVKAKISVSNAKRLARTPLPALVVTRSGGYVVLGSISESQVLVQGESHGRPTLLSRADFEQIWSGRIILLTKCTVSSDPAHRFGIGWFWTAVGKYRRILFEVLIASLIVQLFGLISPLIFQNVIDKVLVHRGLSTLEVLVSGLAAIGLFDCALSWLRTYLFSHTSNRIDVELGSRVFRHLMALPLPYFQARRVGDSVARVRELETIRQFLTGSSITLVLDLCFGMIFLSIMFLYSAELAFIVAATLPLYALISAGATPVFRRRLEEKFKQGSEAQAFLVESISGIETIKSMSVEPIMHRRWEELSAGYVSASFRVSMIGNVASQATSLVNKMTTAVTLLVGARLVINNDMTVGELVAFNMLAAQVAAPVLRLAQVWQDFNQVKISVERLGDILNTPVEPQAAQSQGAVSLKGDIVFENLTFRYRPDSAAVLRDVSLSIKAGELVGIVGPSGSGKSTIAKLIQRLYLPETGRVLVDGCDTSLLDPSWLRRQIGVVLQDSTLFSGTVRDNIALADPAIPIARIIYAAQLAGAHEFIARLPQGYDTPIGERGLSLSGGQRQRLAIARALVGDPRILIFDEATSALDYESESIIQENMRNIVEGRTVIVIAHRLSTVRAADRILTIENGSVVEDGGHEELLMRDGRYAKLPPTPGGHAMSAPRLSLIGIERVDERAFLPAALEVMATPPSPLGRALVLLVAVIVAFAIGWAFVGRLDIVAVAPGKIVARTRTRIVQPFEISTVTNILVSAGQSVRSGDPLIELDPVSAKAERRRARSDLASARLDQLRLSTFFDDGANPTFDTVSEAEHQDVDRAEAELVAQRAEVKAKLANLAQERAQRVAEKEALRLTLEKAQAVLPIVSARAEIRQQAAAIQYGSKLAELEARQLLVEATADIDIDRSKIQSLDAAIDGLDQQTIAFQAELRKTTLADLSHAHDQEGAAQEALAKADHRIALETLRAPIDGTIQQLKVTTVGSVVTPAQQLLSIVPADDAVEVEAVLENRDVGFVKAGQSVEVKIDAYPFTRYGLARGHIVSVDRDAEPAPQRQSREGTQRAADDVDNIEASENLVYTVHITLDPTSLTVDGTPAALVPGMAVKAEIKTGQRRIIDYLLAPLAEYRHDSLRER